MSDRVKILTGIAAIGQELDITFRLLRSKLLHPTDYTDTLESVHEAVKSIDTCMDALAVVATDVVVCDLMNRKSKIDLTKPSLN